MEAAVAGRGKRVQELIRSGVDVNDPRRGISLLVVISFDQFCLVFAQIKLPYFTGMKKKPYTCLTLK